MQVCRTTAWLRYYERLDMCRNAVAFLCFAFVIVIGLGEVVSRRLPGFFDMGATEEIMRYLNIWVILLGIGIAEKRRMHFRVGLLVDNARWPWLRIGTRLASKVCTLMFLSVVVAIGVIKTVENVPQTIMSFPISIAFVYAAIPLGLLLTIIDMTVGQENRRTTPDKDGASA